MAEYYIATDGNDSDPGTIGEPWLTINKANATLVAGDTVYLRGGSYTVSSTNRIDPQNSGNLSNRITYSAYTAGAWSARETPIIKGSPPSTTNQIGAYIDRDYVVIKGILFEDLFQAVYLIGGDYTEVGPDNEIYHTDLDIHASKQPGLFILSTSTNNWIHNNEIHFMGYGGCTGEGHDLIKVGHSTDQISNNNTIEDNLLYDAGHSTLDVYTHYNMIRNNVSHNAGWKPNPGGCTNTPDAAAALPGDDQFGHRNFSSTGYPGGIDQFNFFESNRIGHASMNGANNGADGFSLGGAKNVLRFNYIYGGDGPAIFFKNYGGSPPTLPVDNLIYNNTIFNNGRFVGSHSNPLILHGLEYQASATGNNIRNNILNDNVGGDVKCQGCVGNESIYFPLSTWANNLGDATNALTDMTEGNPTFTDETMTDITSLVLPDLTLAEGSDGINGGTYLTLANGSGSSSTTLIVDNALFFQAGSSASTHPMGSSLSDIQADHIAIGTVTNTVQISDINYSTNTITLSSTMTWDDNANIWLFKKSDGTQVLYDSAPDQGAAEYDASPETPNGLNWIEAEDMTLVSPISSTVDESASEGYYISSDTENQGTATITFNIPTTTTYKILADVYGISGGNDSLFVTVDSEDEITWDFNPEGDPAKYGVYFTDSVTKRGTGTFDSPEYDPYTIYLTSGDHTIVFRGREILARLDKFKFVSLIDISSLGAGVGRGIFNGVLNGV